MFVDDGSSDNSLEILTNIAKHTPKIDMQILYQTNQGIAAARLTAAKHAKYDYILFHDCDDEISSDAIELITKALHADKHIDAILLNLKIQHKANNGDLYYEDFKYKDDKVELTGEEYFLGTLTKWDLHNLACHRKSSFLAANKLYQKYNPTLENNSNNDEIICKLCWIFCKKVVKTDAIYYYKYNPKSSTKDPNQNFYKILRNSVLTYNLARDLSFDHKLHEVITHIFSSIKFVMGKYLEHKKLIHNQQEWLDEFDDTLKFIKTTPTFKEMSFKWKRRYIRLYLKIKLLKIFK